LNFLQILECLNYLDLIQINAKEKTKGYCLPWAGFYLAQLLGPAWPGLAAHGEKQRRQGSSGRGCSKAVAWTLPASRRRGPVGKEARGLW
jgi:hypothetical protein